MMKVKLSDIRAGGVFCSENIKCISTLSQIAQRTARLAVQYVTWSKAIVCTTLKYQSFRPIILAKMFDTITTSANSAYTCYYTEGVHVKLKEISRKSLQKSFILQFIISLEFFRNNQFKYPKSSLRATVVTVIPQNKNIVHFPHYEKSL